MIPSAPRAARTMDAPRRAGRCARVPANALAGETPRTTREPSHPAAAAETAIAPSAASSWPLNHG